jgi:basic membrane protein A
MKKKNLFIMLVTILVLSLLLGACGGAAEPVVEEPAAEEVVVEAPAEEEAEAEEAEEETMEAPTLVKIGVVVAGTLEEPWYSTSMDSLYNLEDNAYGVEVQIDYTENIWGEDSLRVMSEYADAEYDIVWSLTGSDSDYIVQIMDQYPDVLFAHSGGGGITLGKNSVHVWGLVHEPTYIMGLIAGMMTESNVIGMVGSFPSEDVNSEVNSYIAGAKSVNPDVVTKITFINSWWDPDKAKESAVAQIAAGADFIYPTIFGAFEAMDEAGIYGFGNYADQSAMAPNVIVAGSILSWDSSSEYLLDAWYDFATTGNAYDNPDPIYNMMSNGAGGILLYEDLLPEDVLAAAKAKQAEILSGDFVVDFDISVPESE